MLSGRTSGQRKRGKMPQSLELKREDLQEEYNLEQFDAYMTIKAFFDKASDSEIAELKEMIAPYLDFRAETSEFLTRSCADVCGDICFKTGLSDCCMHEGIITFFADWIVNWLVSSKEEIDVLVKALFNPFRNDKCVYLGPVGCIWKIKPMNCETFVCKQAKAEIFARDFQAEYFYDEILARKKTFSFPDRPVLFDNIEKFFMDRGVDSEIMYFHKGAGLLMIKSKAGVI